jgi:ABC-type multidrug transport system ATPase subunit
LIIVDEPTAGLDPAERNRFHNLLVNWRKHHCYFIDSYVDDISNLCNNMAIICLGEVVAKGNELTEGVKGRIWTKDIEKEELANYKQTYKSFLLI